MKLTKFTIVTMFTLAALVACGDTTEVTGVDSETGSLTSVEGRIDPTPTQIREIEALEAAWDAAFAAKNATAYAANYTEDAELVNPAGVIFSGRDAIRALHAFLFGGLLAGSTRTSEVRRMVFLTGTKVMVDLDIALTGVAPGVLRSRHKWIVVKDTGSWRIFAEQITPVAPTT